MIPPRLLLPELSSPVLPDADVLAFKFGVAYGSIFGHRGFTIPAVCRCGADTLRA